MTTLLFRLRRDQRAAIAPMIAIFSTSLIGAAGFALDAAVYYVGNRELRAATESAALAAAMDPAHGMARAQTYLARNGYDPAVLKQVEVGRYCASVHLAPAARFDASRALCPGNGLDTAVRIRTEAPSHQYLTRLLGPMNPIPPLSATATAARIDEAGVGVTSGILDVSGITGSLVDSVNRLLGALLGVQLNLGAATVEALMKGDIDAGLFFDKLAARVGETGTYADLVDRTVSLRDLLSAAADAAGNPGTATALNLVAGRVGSGLQVPLQGLFGLGVWKNMPVGYADEKPGLRAGLNAYQLLAYATQRVGGTIDLSSLTGAVVGNSTVRVGTVVTDAMARPSFSFGPAGETIVGTAAVRLQLQVGLPDITILGQTVTANVPVLLEIAPASASVSDIQCPGTAEQAVETRATISAQTGLVSAFIGKVPASKMSRPFGQPVKASDIDPELIAGLRILGLPVGLTAKAALPNFLRANGGDLIFGPEGAGTIGRPTAPGNPVSIGNRSQIGTSVNALLGNLQVGLTVTPLINLDLALAKSQLVSAVTTPLTGLVSGTVDPLLDNLLAALGIQLGHATVWVTGARCGVPVLV